MNTTYVILGVIALAVIFAISQYNRLVRLNVSVDEGFSPVSYTHLTLPTTSRV